MGKSLINLIQIIINLFLFSLSKTTTATINSSATPLTTHSIPSPRTAIVKFDYDASDTNELSVLAKEV